MLELVKYIVGQFTDNNNVDYIVEEQGDDVNITVVVDSQDIGKVIGRQGKIAKAIRTIVRNASSKENKKYKIEIKEKGEI